MGDKRCTRCGEFKPLSGFYRNAGWQDNLHPYCKVCLLAYQRDRRLEKLDAADPGRRRWTKWSVDHTFFNVIDSPLKAYLLGLLAADGNVLHRSPRITLELAVKDIELVELLRDTIAPAARIRLRRNAAVLAVTSAALADDLGRWGVRPRKTYDHDWPALLPEEAKRPYLLGYFDGDGFTTISRPWGTYEYARWGLLGTLPFVEGARGFIESALGLRRRAIHPKGIIASYYVTGKDALAIDAWLHEGLELGLARKRFDSRLAA
jgi:hypothetical protein